MEVPHYVNRGPVVGITRCVVPVAPLLLVLLAVVAVVAVAAEVAVATVVAVALVAECPTVLSGSRGV